MSEDAADALAVGEFVEYCRTQAGLLSGRVETMAAEADDLLDEIDREMAEIRSRLEALPDEVAGPETPSTADVPDASEVDVAAIEELQAELEEKQLLVEAKQARMQAFQDLAAGYTELAEELASDVDDGQTALTRVVEFEADTDAPVYFDERQTMVEAAAESVDSRDE
ncbi:P-loop NTPase family protein [Natrinema salaciae]|uniref:Uncharacterized protein n=1 Tax=Natrinema salaciae TaxID=1186196 RepID=A0A1H9LXG1_9EURY|nr:hypothetical protein [Natrinema salaciae]SER15959.1 hypothetical protein SAMN04489841_3119 [Natrinema salaciae]